MLVRPRVDEGQLTPGPDVRNRVFALSMAGKVLARFARKFARKVDFKDAENPQSFLLEAFDSNFDQSIARILGELIETHNHLSEEPVCQTNSIGPQWAGPVSHVNIGMHCGIPLAHTLPCQKNSHCRHWERSRSSLKPKVSFASNSFNK